MAIYVCSICGYEYDEVKEKVMFKDLPEGWKCPLCGASKSDFVLKSEKKEKEVVEKKEMKNDTELNNAQLYLLCTNFAKSCEKQYMYEEAELCKQIAKYYQDRCTLIQGDYNTIKAKLENDLSVFPLAFEKAKEDGDRGALRALTWSEKVSKMILSLIGRYQKEGMSFLQNSKIFVCEICGFIYIGDEAPDVCPICKVPKQKIHEVGRD